MTMKTLRKAQRLIVTALLLAAGHSGAASDSRLSDVPIEPDYSGYVRTAPLIELGELFLDTGNIDPGFEAPTGAIWQPQFLVWGELRSAVQDFDSGNTRQQEWVNRLDLFAQLKLAPTERILASFRPLDQDGRYSGRRWEPGTATLNEFNAEVRTLYMEGEIAEIFPGLDPDDTRALDWGFAVGRQPVFIQEGMLINDNIDALGVVRNSIRIQGVSNTRVAAMYGWNHIQRDNNQDDTSARLFGLFTEIDTPCCTLDLDLAYVEADANTGSGYYGAISSVQRFGHLATSFRLLHSEAEDQETAFVSSGTLLFAETSFTPAKTHDNVYMNGFLAVDEFASAARDTEAGGPLGRTGILFASANIGGYGAALSNRADNAFGGAIGYQKFLSGHRRQLIAELGARSETHGANAGAIALGARYQQAIGRHTIWSMDGFLNDVAGNGQGSGLRSELRVKF